MPELITQRIQHINEPSTIRMSRLSRELKEKGKDVINLSLGEPDFDTPEHIRKAAMEAIEQGYTHYPPVAGYPELKAAIIEKFKRDNNLTFTADQIVVSNGAKQAIINVVLSLVEEGDEVIVPAPFWVSYPEMIKLAEAKTVHVHGTLENDYKITPEQLEATITPRTKAFIYSSPCNPTGSYYTYDELKGLVEVFARHPHIYIISDEIYEHINYSGKHTSIAQFEELKDRVVVVNGMSKAFAMTGWRIGYMAGPEWLAKASDKLQGQFTSGACSISQRASIAALTGDMTPTRDMVKHFHSRRDMVIEKIKEIPGIKYNVPQGAFYLFPDVSYYYGKKHANGVIRDADDLCMYLLDNAYVSMVPGTGFGSPECVRLSFATSEENIAKAMDRVKESLSRLE
jgi:aspartate aminotransferase